MAESEHRETTHVSAGHDMSSDAQTQQSKPVPTTSPNSISADQNGLPHPFDVTHLTSPVVKQEEDESGQLYSLMDTHTTGSKRAASSLSPATNGNSAKRVKPGRRLLQAYHSEHHKPRPKSLPQPGQEIIELVDDDDDMAGNPLTSITGGSNNGMDKLKAETHMVKQSPKKSTPGSVQSSGITPGFNVKTNNNGAASQPSNWLQKQQEFTKRRNAAFDKIGTPTMPNLKLQVSTKRQTPTTHTGQAIKPEASASQGQTDRPVTRAHRPTTNKAPKSNYFGVVSKKGSLPFDDDDDSEEEEVTVGAADNRAPMIDLSMGEGHSSESDDGMSATEFLPAFENPALTETYASPPRVERSLTNRAADADRREHGSDEKVERSAKDQHESGITDIPNTKSKTYVEVEDKSPSHSIISGKNERTLPNHFGNGKQVGGTFNNVRQFSHREYTSPTTGTEPVNRATKELAPNATSVRPQDLIQGGTADTLLNRTDTWQDQNAAPISNGASKPFTLAQARIQKGSSTTYEKDFQVSPLKRLSPSPTINKSSIASGSPSARLPAVTEQYHDSSKPGYVNPDLLPNSDVLAMVKQSQANNRARTKANVTGVPVPTPVADMRAPPALMRQSSLADRIQGSPEGSSKQHNSVVQYRRPGVLTDVIENSRTTEKAQKFDAECLSTPVKKVRFDLPSGSAALIDIGQAPRLETVDKESSSFEVGQKNPSAPKSTRTIYLDTVSGRLQPTYPSEDNEPQEQSIYDQEAPVVNRDRQVPMKDELEMLDKLIVEEHDLGSDWFDIQQHLLKCGLRKFTLGEIKRRCDKAKAKLSTDPRQFSQNDETKRLPTTDSPTKKKTKQKPKPKPGLKLPSSKKQTQSNIQTSLKANNVEFKDFAALVEQTKGPTSSEESNLHRPDGRPNQSGKSVKTALNLLIAEHKSSIALLDEEENNDAECLGAEDKCCFVYQVFRKQWSTQSAEDAEDAEEDAETTLSHQFWSLAEANAAAFTEGFKPSDASPSIDLLQFKMETQMDKYGLYDILLSGADTCIKIWVSRFVHSRSNGEIPEDSIPCLPKTLFRIMQETTTKTGDGMFEDESTAARVETVGPTYTTRDQANRAAGDRFIEKTIMHSNLNKLDAMRVEAKMEMRERLQTLLEDDESFDRMEVMKNQTVRIWVEETELVGPRNL
ncbi:hypothetical protein M8818_005646 [Zalaria obscura]|uniref:Uncharacterized protein n=1 Tax=Zalaria obscura TaxID=2024903 RepID=A0ACC3SBN3_9PEZI